MTNNALFTNFKYKSFFSPLKKKVCVEVSFLYNDKPIKRFIFIDKYPEINYLQEAKRIIEREINNGKLEKYCKHYGRNFKPVLITAITTASLVVAAGLGYLGYKYLSPGGATTYTASIAMSEPIEGYSVSLTNEKVIKGKPYATNIKFTHPDECIYHLPNTLEKVSVGGATTTNYKYKLSDPIKEAEFSIPAEAVTGKVEITIKLEKIQPTLVDINGVDCVGCTVDEGQKAEFGASKFSFKVTLDPHYGVPEITKLTINNITLTPGTDYQVLPSPTPNELGVNLLNGKKVDGTVEVTVLGHYVPPAGDTTIKLDSTGSYLWLCDEHDFHFPSNETRFYATEGCTVRLKMQEPATSSNHVPLNIKVTAGNTVLNYNQYDYYFVDDEIAELVITPEVAEMASGSITIAADSTPAIAQFIYEEKAGSVTLSFQATEEGCYLPSIEWGDTGPTESTVMEAYKTYDIVHTFKDGAGVHAINVKRGNGKVPQLIGFNANNDIRPGADEYPDISAPLANYADGTSHIKSAKISNEFSGFIEEGLAYTAINSFCVPSSFTYLYTEAKHFANCFNLDSIYVSSRNESMCSDDAHDLLFRKLPENELTVKVMTNNETQEGVVLDKYNNMQIVGIESFAPTGRSISHIKFGEYCNHNYMGPGPLAGADILSISVDENNPYFVSDNNNALIVNNGGGLYTVYATTSSTKLEIYDDATRFDLWPYSIVGMQNVNISKPVTLFPYSVYSNSGLMSFTTGDVYFDGGLTKSKDPYHLPAIYNCDNLKTVTFNSILSTSRLTAGLIQKCPSVTSLAAKMSDYYGASTNTIYYADGKDKGAAIVVATCSASLLADPQTAGIDWYINNFAPYVFNGNAFGTNRGQAAPAYIYITKEVTSLSEYACVGMSGNAQTHLSIATDNDTYDVQNTTITGRGTQRCVISGENFSPVVSLYFAMLEDSGMDTFRISKPIGTVEARTMISDEAITTVETAANKNDALEFKDNAFYNCPNLRTVDLSSLAAGVVPTINSTRAFIQPECTPFSPKDIKVIVNAESEGAFKDHPVWSQFNITPANI